MTKARIFVMRGKTTQVVGLNFPKDLDDNDLRRMGLLIEDSLIKNFPDIKLIRTPSFEKLFRNIR